MLWQPTTPRHMRHNKLNKREYNSKEKSKNIEHNNEKRKEKGDEKREVWPSIKVSSHETLVVSGRARF